MAEGAGLRNAPLTLPLRPPGRSSDTYRVSRVPRFPTVSSITHGALNDKEISKCRTRGTGVSVTGLESSQQPHPCPAPLPTQQEAGLHHALGLGDGSWRRLTRSPGGPGGPSALPSSPCSPCGHRSSFRKNLLFLVNWGNSRLSTWQSKWSSSEMKSGLR